MKSTAPCRADGKQFRHRHEEHPLAFAPTLLLLATLAANAQTAQLQPQAQRISDRAIQADMASYEATQKRIKALNDQGRPVHDYHLAKASAGWT